MILLTGSHGWIGTRLREMYPDEFLPYDLEIGKDILDYYQLLKDAQKCTKVIHLAAITGLPFSADNPHLYYETNVLGTMNVARICSLLKIPLIYASTDSVEMRNNHYSMSKLAGESVIDVEKCQNGLKAGTIRFPNPYGPEMRQNYVFPIFTRMLESGSDITLQNGGNQKKDFIYIDDLCRIIKSHEPSEHTYYASSGKRRSIKDVATIMKSLIESDSKMVVTEGRVGEVDEYHKPEFIKTASFPTSLEEGIEKYVKFHSNT
jgi:nucleoside-diphosphate-sugar epimerase